MTLQVVSYGGGTNSTALLVGLHERGVRPDLILFADTGGEHERTYRHVDQVDEWCESIGFPPIERVSNAGQHASLEEECHTNKTLPSKAFGFPGCSVKWKRQPMDRFIKSWAPAQEEFGAGRRVKRLIGIDAGESHRGKIPDDKWFTYHFPLIGWDWAREECIEAIDRAGLERPGKSACWFCPAAKKKEVLQLASEHPDLFERAVAMERNFPREPQRVWVEDEDDPEGGRFETRQPTVRGLGRHWSWENLVKADRAQLRLFEETDDILCACFDGDDD